MSFEAAFEALCICINKTHLNPELALQLSASFLAHRALIFQCMFIARLVQEMKKLVDGASTKEVIPPSKITSWPLNIGIIGCGNVGSGLLEDLLACGLYHKSWLTVSTRQPNNLSKYQSVGVHCCFDNAYVAENAEVLFICCPPAHLRTVATDIKGHLLPHCVVLSTCAGVTAHKLMKMLDHPFCFTTNLKAHVIAEHFASSNVPPLNMAHPSKLDAQRLRDLLILTCPFDTTSDFFERLLYCLCGSLQKRGYSFSSGLRAFISVLFGKTCHVLIKVGDSDINEDPVARYNRFQPWCTVEYVAENVIESTVPEMIQSLKQKYMGDSLPLG